MTGRTVRVIILGSGTSTGVPVVGCGCRVCRSENPKNVRSRCSVLLSFGGRNVLIDTSTDLRQQALREKIDRIDAVLYTHTHADHVHGIDDLRPFNLASGEKIPIYGSAETIAVLRRNFGYIFHQEPQTGYLPRLETRVIDGPFRLFDLPIEPVELEHGEGRSLGFRIGSFAYLTDCSRIPDRSVRRLQGLEVLVIDGLRYRPHSTHFNIEGAVEAAKQLGVGRTLLTHLSHDVEHERCSSELPPGIELAYDGQRIDLPPGGGDSGPLIIHSP